MKQSIRALLIGVALAAVPVLSALAQTTVKDAWVRGTVPQQTATGLFAQLTSAAGGKLISVSSPVAGLAEIHEMSMANGVMQMRQIANGLPIPAGESIVLKPGGYHVMLIGLRQRLTAGESLPLTLTFEKAGNISVTVPIKAMGSMQDSHGDMGKTNGTQNTKPDGTGAMGMK